MLVESMESLGEEHALVSWPLAVVLAGAGLTALVAWALLHERPHACGKPRSTWTLRLAAEVCWERGLTPYQVSIETIRQARLTDAPRFLNMEGRACHAPHDPDTSPQHLTHHHHPMLAGDKSAAKPFGGLKPGAASRQ
jgi:hypothetical protein